MLGDTVGKPGRKACVQLIPKLVQAEGIDFVVVNGENVAGGSSITEETANELFGAGVDVITTGDHIFKKKEATPLLERNARVLRPLNYPRGVPGSGSVIAEARNGVRVAVINVLGRVFLKTLDCPFQTVEREIEKLRRETSVILVDIHAEATSEKVAMGWFLDGRVSAVVGSHTHVQTADETILPRGTAYITELGMCGPYRSVIGRKVENVLHQFITQIPTRLEVASEDPRISGALIEIDDASGRARSIRRVHEKMTVTEETKALLRDTN
jgi:metallophosphoesterase (TIGR00282 family)